MAEFLVIRLGASKESLASWIVVDGNGTRRSPLVTGRLQEAAKDVLDRAVVVLVPADETATLTVDLPAKGARLRAALPFALEEQVADEIENLHFAPGKRFENGTLPVAVVAHEKMQEWLVWLDDAGIRPARLVPENHGLSFVPNTLSLLVAEGRLMFNDGVGVQFVMQEVSPSEALTAAGVLGGENPEGSAGHSKHLLVYCEPTEQHRFEHDWAALRAQLDSVDINLLPDGVLPRLAVTVASGAGIDLLQGAYGERIDVGAAIRPWRFAALLLLGLGVLGMAGKAIDYVRLKSDEAQLKDQFAAEYRKIRPQDTREIMDPTAIVDSIRRGFGAAATAPPVFLPSLQQLASALAGKKDAQIQAISYRAGVIDVRLTAPDVATLDAIVNAISQSARFKASIRSTDRVADRVNSRIQIQESSS